MKLHTRLDKVEAAIAAREPKEPFRIVRMILTPEREVTGARYNGMAINRKSGESEEDFRARVSKEIREADSASSRPLVPVTDDDINL